MIWIMVVLLANGATPVAEFKTKAECDSAVLRMYYELAPGYRGPSILCVEGPKHGAR
jgi:hypothetical protein